MVFRKYRPAKQWGKMDTRIFKEMMNARSERKMPAFRVPEAVKAAGVEIHDPLEPSFWQNAQKEAEVKVNHPAFRAPSIEDHPLYNKTRAFIFDGSEAMSDGMAQACALSNAILHEGLPEEVLSAADGIEIGEDKVADAILHGEKFDPTLEKLPARFDPVLFWIKHVRVHGTPVVKRNNIILNNLYRHVALARLHKGADHLRCDRDEPLSSIVRSDAVFGSSPLVLRHQPHLTIQASAPAKPWLTGEKLEQLRCVSLESIAPLSPLIDLGADNVYNDGALLARQSSPLHVNTVMWSREQNQKYPWTTEQNAANAILHTLGAAVAEATRAGGERDLDKNPVLVKGVQLVDGKMDLVAVQLNTLHMDGSDGRRNAVWVERAARLYQPRPFWEQLEEVKEVNMDTFHKFAALLLSR